MNQDDVEKLLNRLRVAQLRFLANGWVKATCPFARAHAKGVDKDPSFCVSIVPDGPSRYRCHACGRAGEMGIQFLWALKRVTNEDYEDIESWIAQTNELSVLAIERRLDRAEAAQARPSEIAGVRVGPRVAASLLALEDLPLLPDAALDSMVRPREAPEVWDFLTGTGFMPDGTRKKGFASSTIDAFDLRWHAGTERVGIPIRDVRGRLVGISGRALYKEQKPKFLHSKGFRRDAYLFGEHMLSDREKLGLQTGFLVEGFWDVMWLWQWGYRPVFGVMGSYMSAMQIEKAVMWAKSIRIVPDGDAPGWESAERWEKGLAPRVPVGTVDMADGKDPDDLGSEDLLALLGPPSIAG